jgi:hypothetical protein
MRYVGGGLTIDNGPVSTPSKNMRGKKIYEAREKNMRTEKEKSKTALRK